MTKEDQGMMTALAENDVRLPDQGTVHIPVDTYIEMMTDPERIAEAEQAKATFSNTFVEVDLGSSTYEFFEAPA
jgi:hypothetical protein